MMHWAWPWWWWGGQVKGGQVKGGLGLGEAEEICPSVQDLCWRHM